MSVEALRPHGKVNKQALVALGNDPDLENFQLVCHWKDGRTTVGWMADITHSQIVFGAAMLTQEVNDRVFLQPPEGEAK